MAKVDYDADRFDAALAHLDRVLTEAPKSDAAAEAIYLRGVCGYKTSGDPSPLKAAWERLQAEYPGSEWTRRAYPYRLL